MVLRNRVMHKTRNLSYNIKRIIKKTFFFNTYNIIKKPSDIFPVYYHIKDNTWEDLYISEVFEISKEYVIKCFHKNQDIIELNNVIISPCSNILITDKGVIWDKSEGSNFTKVIPLDSNLAGYNPPQIKVLKNKKIKEINDECIFLGGVHSTIWSHFLVEYLPKLYYACDSGLLEKPIKVLIPKYNDPHIREIVYDYVSLYPNASLIELDNKCDYKCKRLFHIPIASQASDHADYCMPIDFLLPTNVVVRLRNHLMQYVIPDNHFYEKIYLARRGTYRSMSNWQEAEDYFAGVGFKIIKPHEMTLEEKITMFYNAKIIVGPYSAAFTNLLFSNKCKVLIFSPLIRAYETYYKTIGQISELDILNVTGTDSSSNIHTSFFVPVEKIKQAYYKLLNG